VRQEELSQLKKTMISSRIEPATLRLVVQCLKQLRHRVSRMDIIKKSVLSEIHGVTSRKTILLLRIIFKEINHRIARGVKFMMYAFSLNLYPHRTTHDKFTAASLFKRSRTILAQQT
jgi:hypothetical protein